MVKQEDLERANVLLEETQKQAGVYEARSVYYSSRNRRVLFSSGFLVFGSLVLNIVWPNDSSDTNTLILILSIASALNTVLACMSAVARFDVKDSLCAAAAAECNETVQRIVSTTQMNTDVLNEETLSTLIADAQQRESNIKHDTASIPTVATAPAPGNHAAVGFANETANKLKGFAGSTKVVPLEHSNDATTTDFINLEQLVRTLSDRNQQLTRAHDYYRNKYYMTILPFVVLSAASSVLSTGFSEPTKVYRGTMLLLAFINVALLYNLYLTQYRQHSVAAESAASRYNLVLTEVTFAARYRIDMDHGSIAALLLRGTIIDQQIQSSLSHDMKKRL